MRGKRRSAWLHRNSSLHLGIFKKARIAFVTQGAQTLCAFVEISKRGTRGSGKPDCPHNVLSAASAPRLLATAHNLSRKWGTRLNVQGAHALRSPDFMRRDGEGINAPFLHRNRDLAECLGCIHMKKSSRLVRNCGKGGDIHNATNLVVDCHNGYEQNPIGKNFLQSIGRDVT